VPNPEGTLPVGYTGPGANAFTMHWELNKLALYVGIARIFAPLYRPQFLGHRIDPYAAMAAG